LRPGANEDTELGLRVRGGRRSRAGRGRRRGLDGGDGRRPGPFLAELPAEGEGADFVEARDGLAADVVEFGDGQDDVAFQVVAEGSEAERGAAEAPELFPEAFLGERLAGGRGEGEAGFRPGHVAQGVAEHEGEGGSRAAVDFEIERAGLAGEIAGEGLLELAFEFRVAGLPNPVTGAHAREVDRTAEERERDLSARRTGGDDLENPATFLAFVGAPGVEDDAVAGLEGPLGAEPDALGPDPGHLSEVDAAFLAEAGVDEGLVVDAPEPPGVEAATERHLQFVGGRRSGRTRGGVRPAEAIQRGAVDAGDAGDVLGGLQAALDLERRDAGTDEFGEDLESGEVLGAEEVASVAEIEGLAVGDQFVRKPAGLGALAAVGGASAERFAGEALAGVGDAEGAVDEDFEGQGRSALAEGVPDSGDFGDGILAGEDHELAAQFAHELDPGRAGDRHLGRGVDGEVRGEPPDQAADADILHDGGVDAGGDDRAEVVFGLGKFGREDQRVESDVAPDTAAMEPGHQFRQVDLGEVVGSEPGVETGEPEIDRVGTVLDRGADAVPIARRGEEFGAAGGRGGNRGGRRTHVVRGG
jgi:hypothetical protein